MSKHFRSNRLFRPLQIALLALTIGLLTACGSMPATRSGFLTDAGALRYEGDGSVGRYRAPVAIDTTRVVVADVQWRADDNLSLEERAALTEGLRQALTTALTPPQASPGTTAKGTPSETVPKAAGRAVVVRAAITRVETVSTAANVVSTALLFVPLDRGGAAVELEALDTETLMSQEVV